MDEHDRTPQDPRCDGPSPERVGVVDNSDEAAARRGEAHWKQLLALGLTPEEILSDDSVAMTTEEMDAWLASGAPSPFAAR